MQFLAREPGRRVVKGLKEMWRQLVGIEDGSARLERRGYLAFKGHGGDACTGGSLVRTSPLMLLPITVVEIAQDS